MQPENRTVPVRKDDLDILVAACTSHLPPDVSPEVTGAFGRILESFDEVHGIAGDIPGSPPREAEWQRVQEQRALTIGGGGDDDDGEAVF